MKYDRTIIKCRDCGTKYVGHQVNSDSCPKYYCTGILDFLKGVDLK